MSPPSPDGSHDQKVTRAAAVLVAVQLPGVDDLDHAADLQELGRLVHTLGYDVVATVSQRRSAIASSAVLGAGKLRELGALTGGSGIVPTFSKEKKSKAREKPEFVDRAENAQDDARDGEFPDDFDEEDENQDARQGDDRDARDSNEAGDFEPRAPGGRRATIVVVDHEITPSQARNLEKATDAEVLDRTGVIVEIFHRHARSREAKLQVEIARLAYVAPRMRETGGGDRQRGGIGGKGAGESSLELDRRKIRDRIAELRAELVHVVSEQKTRAKHRRDQLRVALVGYTNAGKSSLMRALTGSDVLVADKLFATLDTTVRALHPETRPRLLVSDTVGFIKKLPHDLVASFRSTLDEALEASLLLYVVDASDATHEAQLQVTRDVLSEIGAHEVPWKLVLNKCDRLDDLARAKLRAEHPDAIQLSARIPADVVRLRSEIVAFFESSMDEEEIVVPYEKQALVSEIHSHARVLSEEYDEAGAHVRFRAQPATIARLRALIAR